MTDRQTVHLIAAARPNFMKVAPLYHALVADGSFEVGGFPSTEGHLGALLAIIDGIEEFEVGSHAAFQAQRSGWLSLTINDNDCSDNWGSLRVEVTTE